jgi:hypothetical protein
MNVPLFELKAQYPVIRKEVRDALERIFDSQHFVLGPEGEALKRRLPAIAKPDLPLAARPGRMRCCWL